MILKRGTGNGEQGTGNGEQGTSTGIGKMKKKRNKTKVEPKPYKSLLTPVKLLTFALKATLGRKNSLF